MAKNLQDLLVFINLHNCYTLQQLGVTGINMYLDGGNTKTMLTSCSLNMKTWKRFVIIIVDLLQVDEGLFWKSIIYNIGELPVNSFLVFSNKVCYINLGCVD